MKLYISIPALVAAGFLSACSSNNPAAVSQGEALLGLVEAVSADTTDFEIDADDLPDSASMTGNIAAAFANDVAYVGDASVTANFEAGTMTGTASNFNEYTLAGTDDACLDVPADCDATLTRSLDGSLAIIGDITGTSFEYYAFGSLTAEDDEYGTVVAQTYLDGDGAFGKLEDGTLVAAGVGDAGVYLYSSEDGDLGYVNGDSVIVLSE